MKLNKYLWKNEKKAYTYICIILKILKLVAKKFISINQKKKNK